jgi:rhodanese-related sulfurtransferase
MAAQNHLDGVEMVSPLTEISEATVLDVRVPEEREERPISAGRVIEIEFSELRRGTHEFPEGQMLVACAHGTRSAEAVRWLHSQGHRARLLGGGVSWRVRAIADSGPQAT